MRQVPTKTACCAHLGCFPLFRLHMLVCTTTFMSLLATGRRHRAGAVTVSYALPTQARVGHEGGTKKEKER